MRVFRERLSVCMCASFPFGFEDGMWDVIVFVADHCLSFYFVFNRDLNYLIMNFKFGKNHPFLLYEFQIQSHIYFGMSIALCHAPLEL